MSDRNLGITMIVLGSLLALTVIPMMKGYKMPGASVEYNKIKMILNLFIGATSVILGIMILAMNEMKNYIPFIFFGVILLTFIVDMILKRTLKRK